MNPKPRSPLQGHNTIRNSLTRLKGAFKHLWRIPFPNRSSLAQAAVLVSELYLDGSTFIRILFRWY